jgi:tRNA(Ile2) C34 agmatinyltransferase TiaS
MTEQRQKLLDRFDKWLDSKPRKQIISAQCANIAEEYAEEQLRLHVVSQQRELLSCDCPKCGKEMISELVKHHHCNKCKEHYTST